MNGYESIPKTTKKHYWLKKDNYQQLINQNHFLQKSNDDKFIEQNIKIGKYYPQELNIQMYNPMYDYGTEKNAYPKSCERVIAYLNQMKQLYDLTRKMTRLDLYVYFCDLEKQYVDQISKQHEDSRQHKHITYDLEDVSINYCHTVHKTYPDIYDNDNRTTKCYFSMTNLFTGCLIFRLLLIFFRYHSKCLFTTFPPFQFFYYPCFFFFIFFFGWLHFIQFKACLFFFF